MPISNLERVKEWQKRNAEKVAGYKKKWSSNNPEKIRDKNKRLRALNPEHYRELKRNWRRANPDKAREEKRRRWKEHPEKIKAHNAVHYAIKTGNLFRPEHCSKCMKKCKPEGHHHKGYELKLEVIWLCQICHRIEHANH